jgi:uncharacterized protein with HEPN domain
LLQELADIAAFTVDDETAFVQDAKTQKAVIRCYEVIGEIAKRLPAELHDTHDKIDWRELITFRDFLAHNYDKIVLRYLWDAVEDLPKLKMSVKKLLSELEDKTDNQVDCAHSHYPYNKIYHYFTISFISSRDVCSKIAEAGKNVNKSSIRFVQ